MKSERKEKIYAIKAKTFEGFYIPFNDLRPKMIMIMMMMIVIMTSSKSSFLNVKGEKGNKR